MTFEICSSRSPPSGPPLGPGTFADEGPAYRIGLKPLCIEVLTKISGVTFEEASRDTLRVEIDGRSVSVIGRQALLKNKRAAARHKDLDDVEWLERNGG